MAWSDQHQRMWCCVYGTHPALVQHVHRRPVWRLVVDEYSGSIAYRRNMSAVGAPLVNALVRLADDADPRRKKVA